MKLRRLLCLVLGWLLLLVGCGKTAPAESGATLTVYCLSADGADTRMDLLQPREITLSTNAYETVDTAMHYFGQDPDSDSLVCALPEGVTVESWSISNRALTLNLSEGFATVDAMRQTETAFCAVLTFCAFDEVEAVNIVCAGQTIFHGLTEADALLPEGDSAPNVRQLHLYFADESGQWLVGEYHSLTVEDDSELERYVLEELLRGPNDESLVSPLPAGTRLLGYATENNICTVNLSTEFVENMPQTALGERLALYSIVNSLTTLSHVDGVLITVEGEAVTRYLYRDLTEPLLYLPEAIGPASSAKGQISANLYRLLPDGSDRLTPLPCVLSPAEEETAASAAAAALIGGTEPGYPVCYAGEEVLASVVSEGQLCRVDVTEDFFAYAADDTERLLAVQALVATLCDTDAVSVVRLTLRGDFAVYDGVDYSGPWTMQDVENIIQY